MTASLPRMIVADLDGTLLHDADTFEGRFITRRSIDAIHQLHDRGFIFAIATARPVSTGYEFVEKLPVDACVYLNGALIDLSPDRSDYDMLTSGVLPQDGHLLKIGFPSERAVQVCRYLLEAMPGLKVGIVMDDIRYVNWDISEMWKSQQFVITDFSDVPPGIADKIIAVPRPDQWDTLRGLVPPDFELSVSENTLAMLMNPLANKKQALRTLCARMEVPLGSTVSFGDDLIDIAMLRESGTGVAVANANPSAGCGRRDLSLEQRGRRGAVAGTAAGGVNRSGTTLPHIELSPLRIELLSGDFSTVLNR